MENISRTILKKLFNAHAEVLKSLRILRKASEIPFDQKTYKACMEMVDNIDQGIREVDQYLQSTE